MKYETEGNEIVYLYLAFSKQPYVPNTSWSFAKDFKLNSILHSKKSKEFVLNPVLNNESPLDFKLDTIFDIKK
jgi:hypothetical protein